MFSASHCPKHTNQSPTVYLHLKYIVFAIEKRKKVTKNLLFWFSPMLFVRGGKGGSEEEGMGCEVIAANCSFATAYSYCSCLGGDVGDG